MAAITARPMRCTSPSRRSAATSAVWSSSSAEPLFRRQGRGVELTAFGERAAAELAEVLGAHDQALVHLARETDADGPFMLGTVEHIVDPVLPALLGAIRAHVGDRPLQLRVDRSLSLAAAFAQGEVDAAIVLDPGEVGGALDFGPLTLRWYVGAGVPQADELPDPLPMVAYDEPCHMRELAMARVRSLGLAPVVSAQSPHLSGIQSAVRSGLGYALLADGGDGLRPVSRGPLAEPIQSRLWLLLRPADQALAAAAAGGHVARHRGAARGRRVSAAAYSQPLRRK